MMSEDQEDVVSSQAPLPFGQKVLSEAYEAQDSISASQHSILLSELFTILQDVISSVKNILSDSSLSEAEKITQSLKLLKNEKLPTKQQPKNNEECINSILSEPTIQIELQIQDILSDVKLDGGHQTKCEDDQHLSQERKQINKLKKQLYSGENEILLLKKQKQQAQIRHQKQINELISKIQMGESFPYHAKLQQKNQQIGKMNKWLQTLNKLLHGAHRQAATYKQKLKKTESMAVKQLKQKEEEKFEAKQKLQSTPSKELVFRSINSILSTLDKDEKSQFRKQLFLSLDQQN